MTGQCCEGQTICKSCLDQWQIANCWEYETSGLLLGKGFSQNYHVKRVATVMMSDQSC